MWPSLPLCAVLCSYRQHVITQQVTIGEGLPLVAGTLCYGSVEKVPILSLRVRCRRTWQSHTSAIPMGNNEIATSSAKGGLLAMTDFLIPFCPKTWFINKPLPTV